MLLIWNDCRRTLRLLKVITLLSDKGNTAVEGQADRTLEFVEQALAASGSNTGAQAGMDDGADSDDEDEAELEEAEQYREDLKEEDVGGLDLVETALNLLLVTLYSRPRSCRFISADLADVFAARSIRHAT